MIKTHFKYFTFFSTLYVTILLSAVLLDYKFTLVNGMFASAATFIISFTFLLSDVIAEVYEYEKARQVLFSSIICLVFFGCIIFAFGKLTTPNEYKKYGDAYSVILNLLFRACIANAIALTMSAFLNVYLVSKWKEIMNGRYFWLRGLGASVIGEIIYTIFVVFLVNFGLVSFKNFLEILTISFLFKLVFDVVAILPLCILVYFLKKAEKIDIFNSPKIKTPFEVRQNN